MLKFTGQVLVVQDQEREFPEKANGVPTGKMVKHRVTSIQLLVGDKEDTTAMLIKGFDLPSTFKLPVRGEKWTTPNIRTYDATTGLPEVSLFNE